MRTDYRVYLLNNRLASELPGNYRPEKILSAEKTAEALAEHGFDRMLLHAWPFVSPELCREQNDLLLDARGRLGDRARCFCTVCPGYADDLADAAAKLLADGASGIGMLDPYLQHFDIDDPAFEAVFALCEDKKVPVSFRTALSVGEPHLYASPYLTAYWLDLINKHPGLPLFFNHYGAGIPFFAQMPEIRKTLTNVFIDISPDVSPMRDNAPASAAMAMGEEHILFGSAYPFFTEAFSDPAYQETADRRNEEAEGLLW